jgi:exosortase
MAEGQAWPVNCSEVFVIEIGKTAAVHPLGVSAATGILAPDTGTTWKHRARVLMPQLLFLGLFLVLLYGKVGVKLVSDWYQLPDFSHGFLIPFFVLFLLWDRRERLSAAPIRPSWAGLQLVLFALGVLMMGVYGAELFLSRISLVFLLAGIVWTLAGWQMMRELRFVFFVMLLGIPLPAVLFNQITFPLQLMASRVASAILPFFGVPVLREGNIIELASIQLEVAEACSGIRSLMSLFTVAVLYGYFMQKSRKKRVLLALASVPIAVAANVFRIVGTGLCVQYWDPDKALGFFHEFSGWLMFVLSLGCLHLVNTLLSVRRGNEGKSA